MPSYGDCRSVEIDAPPQACFDALTDFERLPEWQGAVKRINILERDEQGRGTVVEYEVDAKVKTVTYTLAYDYSEAPEAFSWSLLDGDVKEISGSYRFDEFDDVTEVQYEARIDPGFPIPAFLKRQGEKQLAKAALQDLKKRVESLK